MTERFAKKIFRSQLFLDGVGVTLARYIRFVRATSSVVRQPADIVSYANSLHPGLVAMWHGQFLMLPVINEAKIPVSAMVARHRDGELIGRVLVKFDMGLIRGAGSGYRKRDRGGARALRSAVDALRDGTTVAMTADIPKAKPREAGNGIVMIARISGRPIVPVAIATKRYLSFNTWSRFTVNLPFSKLAMVIGDPIWVPRNVTPAEMEEKRREVEDQLNSVTARAYELAGSVPVEIDAKLPAAQHSARLEKPKPRDKHLGVRAGDRTGLQ